MSRSSSPNAPRTPLSDTQRKYGIVFKKSLGQNLLLDDNINRIMVDAAGLTGEEDVVEVGAGLGALTRHLAPRVSRLLAIEIDRAFMPSLEEQFGGVENVVLFRGDVLNHDLGDLVEEFLPNPGELKMLSNLPYYITTPILFHFWESQLHFSRMVVMVQQEVGHRMVSPVNSHDYGVLTLAAAYFSEVDIVHKVPRTCFRPKPKVDSVIVRLRNRAAPLYPDLDRPQLMKVVRTAFAHRRKTLRNSLAALARPDVGKETVYAAVEAAGVDLGRRPQTLSLDEFAEIARRLKEAGCLPKDETKTAEGEA